MSGNHKHKILLAIDVDDVLLDLGKPLSDFHNLRYGTNLKYEDIKFFDLSKVWQCSEKEVKKRVMEFYLSSDFDVLPTFEGVSEALNYLKKASELIVLTSRPPIIKEKTIKNLEMHFPGVFSQVCQLNNMFDKKVLKTKGDMCLELGVSILIDDCLDNVFSCSDLKIPSILIRRPWNEEVSDSELKERHIFPVNNWGQVSERFNSIRVSNFLC